MLGSAHGVVVDLAELSDAGRDPTKQINEDASGYTETPFGHLALVCDGMGGHSAGREASQAAVRAVIEGARRAPRASRASDVLRSSIELANEAVYAVGGEAPPELRPGSTCVAVLLADGRAEIAHVGDSRVYLVRGGAPERLTRDHSMVQQLVDSGMLDAAHAASHPEANRITRALGIDAMVEVELRPKPLELAAGDTLLLCSDGLTDLVTDAEIAAIVGNRIGSGAAAVCQELVSLANGRGGHDNITVVVLHVLEITARAPRGAGATLVTDAPSTLTEAGPAPTVFDEPAPRTQPGVTHVDEPGRVTEPNLGPAALPRFSHDEPAGGFPTHPPRSRAWVTIVVILALTVIGGLAAWGVVKLLHRGHAHDEGEVVPPPTTAPAPPQPPAPSAAPSVTIEPEVEVDSGSP